MDSVCVQGDALAADPSWLELLLSLLASEKLPAAVGETVSALLGAEDTPFSLPARFQHNENDHFAKTGQTCLGNEC
eukprot:COSAG06_NODE_84_length_25090_cov_20.561042_23_plen_76_part_00